MVQHAGYCIKEFAMIKGRCECGSVQYEVNGELSDDLPQYDEWPDE